ncbi:MAG: competence/damage-inducible protein A [Planctomycetota bacterium]|nr:competence/damage-inducible protein A [Planctomycetota bacterium]
MTTAEIITIGTEIVLGQIANTNSQYIAKVLTERGIQALFQTSIADDKESLKSILKIANDRANLIITTGGLGPTANDITRETVSEFFGVPLVIDKESYARSQNRLAGKHENMLDEYRKQALIPEGAFVISNDNGTANGFALRHGEVEIVCLPGVPREMQFMLNKYLEIYALKGKREEGCKLIRNLHTFGISERAVEDAFKDCSVAEGQIKTITLVHDGIVTINMLVTAIERESAVEILNRAERDMRKKFGRAVFGVDDMGLEDAVAMLLKGHNKTIAVAESCTGGLVSDKLTNIPGISEFFLEGIVAYSNKAKIDILGVPEDLILKYGAVSPQVARAMADGVKKKSSANIGIGITGIAGPTGATKEKPVGLVYVAVVVDDSAEVKEYRFRGSRIDIKKFSANTALNMVRLKLMDNC